MKKRSKGQRIGMHAENVFRSVASAHGLMPTKVEEDFVVDFICQVEREVDSDGIALISGTVFGVFVRGTKKNRPRIPLSRSDVENLLNCRFPVIVSLVHLRESGDANTYFRLVDQTFAYELAKFLESRQNEITCTPSNFLSETHLRELVNIASEPGFAERIQLCLSKYRMLSILPNVNIRVYRQCDGQFSLVSTPNFQHLFDKKSDSRELLRSAIFGSSQYMRERLQHVPIRGELFSTLSELPQPVVITGPIGEHDVVLEVVGPLGSAECKFGLRRTDDYTGFVHSCGFSIQVSDAIPDNNMKAHFHLFKTDVDPDVSVAPEDIPNLLSFLAKCLPGQSWGINGLEWKLQIDQFGDLINFGFFAKYLLGTVSLIKWPKGIWQLSDANSEEALNTLSFIYLLAEDKELLDGFGFSVIKIEELSREKSLFSVPVCANLPRGGIVIWLDVDGNLLYKNDQIAGIQLQRTIGINIDILEQKFVKTSLWPELVLTPDWPTIQIGPKFDTADSDATEWSCGLRFT